MPLGIPQDVSRFATPDGIKGRGLFALDDPKHELPIPPSPPGGVGPGFYQSSLQPGPDLNSIDPNDLANYLGRQGFTPGYDSNRKGSFEGNFNTLLNKLTPDQLIQRYRQGSAPQYQTATDQLQSQAYQTIQQALGRDPTGSEYAQLLAAFQGPNGLVAGRSAAAQYADQIKNSPTELAKRAPQYSGDVQGIFHDLLKRGATQDELSHFGGLLASGQVDPYTLRQFVTQLPEYQGAQDQQFRGGLNDELQGYDQKFFNNAKSDVISQFMQNGIQGSTALDTALTQLMGQIADKRSNFLAGLSSQQYQGNKENARADYSSQMQKFLDDQNYNRQRSNSQIDYLTQRGYNGLDYQTQQNDFMNYLNSQKRNAGNPIYGLAGGIVGAGIGGFSGPQGAMAGYQIGSGIGNGFNYLNH